MPYEIVWAPTANETLDQAIRHIAKDRPVAASDFRSRAHECVDRLALLPNLGSLLEVDRSKRWRELFCEPYRIFYRVIEARKRILVGHFWHASRDEPTRADLLG